MPAYRKPSPDVRRYCEEQGFSRWVCEGGFDYLLHRWGRAVARVEESYRLSFYEFLNDMSARRIIDEMATYASDDEWAAVEAALPSLDARFVAATRPVETCVCGEHNAAKFGYSPDRDWWYYRVPLDLSSVSDRDRWP